MFGNKIDNLEKLKENGIRVPDFTVVRFEDVIDVTRYQKRWEEYADEPLLQRLHGCVRTDFREHLSELLPRGEGLMAIRSSCNLEDGADHSFAGQFRTFLNVPYEELPEKVLQCVESLFDESVLHYLKECKLPARELQMCVLVQRMVQADRAGVLFTANPQGILNESVIAVGRGLGEGVVSGSADVTTYYYHRTDLRYYYEGKEELLTPGEVSEMISLSEKLEGLFGPYLDVEFALEQGLLYVLQVRKITTLCGDHPLILDNSNIVESYPGISLPLTISFVHMVYSGVFRGVSKRVLKNDKELSKHEAVFQNMVGHANGRIYYMISNWYTVLKFLPFSKKIIPVWQEMMGVRSKSYDTDEVNLNWFVRFMTYVNSLCELLSVPRHMKQLEARFQKVNEEFYAHCDHASPAELKKLYDYVKAQLLDVWDVTLLNDMNTFISTGLVKHRLKKKHPGEDDYVNRYISGISDIESMKPVRALIDLAYDYDKLSKEELAKRKTAYLQEYGDRNLEELKLESKTFRSHPELLEEKITQYREDLGRLQTLHEEMNAERKPEKKEDFLTRKLGKICAAGIAGREKSRLNRCRVYGMVRLIFRRLGEAYAGEGILADPEDVFYLTIEEAFDPPKETLKLVEQRKAEYKAFSQLPAYTRLIFEEEEFDKHPISVKTFEKTVSGSELQGVPCSAGEVTAPALVIKNVADAKDVKDKILVTRMTDPGWVFLLTTAKGVISEKGSLLSHTAIISRELGVPSVVGVENLMESVRTGDILHLNGNTGKIEILRRKEDEVR